MVSECLVIIGLIFELSGAVIAILDKIPILNKMVGQICSFKHIDKGLEKLEWKTLDENLPGKFLRKNDEGFKEIFHIINKRFGPYPKDIDAIYFNPSSNQKTVETSIFNVIIVKFNNCRKYEEYPTTRRDLLLRIDVWKERYLIVRGFILVFLGTFLQLLNIFT